MTSGGSVVGLCDAVSAKKKQNKTNKNQKETKTKTKQGVLLE